MLRRFGILLAIGCSIVLTIVTFTPPQIPGDWARLNKDGVYVARAIDYPWPSYAVQIGLLAGVIGGLIAVSTQQSVINKREKRNTVPEGGFTQKQRYRGAEKGKLRRLFLLVVITLVGFGLRAYTLESLPLIIDEIGFAAHASDILHGQHVPILAPGHNANPSAYSWLVAGVMAVFGQTAFAARLIPLAVGTLSIPAMYFFAQRWWGRRIGLLAAGFLAVYPVHVHFSRMSMYNIFDPLWAMLALGCLPHLHSHPGDIRPAAAHPIPANGEGEQRHWILTGILMGVAQYFYHGARVLPVLIAVYLAVSFFKRERNSGINLSKALWRNVLWMGFAFGVVALPRFVPVLVGGLPITGNMDGLRLPADLGANSLRSVLAWVGQPDVSPFWLSDSPLLEWGMLAAFVVGLIVCVRRIDDPRNAVLVMWIALTTVFGGIIWAAAPLYIRYLSAAPAMMVLAARGVEVISEKIQRRETDEQRDGGRRRRVLIVLIGIISLQGVYTALRHPDEAYGRISASQWAEDGLAKRAALVPEGLSTAFIVGDDFDEVQAITLAHSVAAYGQRRSIALVRGGDEPSEQQTATLGDDTSIVVIKESSLE